mgnify:CR=1 FL=1
MPTRPSPIFPYHPRSYRRIAREFVEYVREKYVCNMLLTPQKFNRWGMRRGYGKLINGRGSLDTLYSLVLEYAGEYFEVTPALQWGEHAYWLRRKPECRGGSGGIRPVPSGKHTQ